MFLYKLEIKLDFGQSPDPSIANLIVLADSDESAFGYAEGHLVRHYVKLPHVLETAIVEKKRVEKGNGYVVEAAAMD